MEYAARFETGESVYALIPDAQITPPKPPMHVSKHKGATDPREWPMGVPKRASATFGVPLGTYKPDPKGFTKKHAGEITLPDPKAPSKPKDKLKVPLIKKNDKPIMGLVSAKNFVTANAVENILMQPKRLPEGDIEPMKKADFAKIPQYLDTVKQKIAHEKAIVHEFNARMTQAYNTEPAVRKMSEGERSDLLVSLKARWQHTNSEYQKLPFHVGTDRARMRKEKYEANLAQIEKDIETLSRKVVLVADED
jgi:hypothetical protein